MMNRCGLCGGTTDGEPAADNPSEVPAGEANGSFKPQDESCLADVTIDTKKSDGFGPEKGWLGRLLGPLGEQFGVGGVWVHENCAIWSPEVGFHIPALSFFNFLNVQGFVVSEGLGMFSLFFF